MQSSAVDDEWCVEARRDPHNVEYTHSHDLLSHMALWINALLESPGNIVHNGQNYGHHGHVPRWTARH
jgi:hypothetical protein